ncbi:MAG: outer membrane lipoprotein-sorting protein [Nitrospiria bacterium]
MKNSMYRALVIIFWSLFEVSASNFTDPQEIIANSDRIRNSERSFKLTNKLTEYDNGSPRNEMQLDIYAKKDRLSGQYKTLVRYIEPPRDNGKMVLFNGSQMWFYDSFSKASVRISPQQRLMGQASEGDVVTVNLAQDYRAKLIGEEHLDDADRVSHDCWRFDLSPANDGAIYGRIEYWVEKGSYKPVKGKFYSDSGRLLKIAYYHRYEEELGDVRPTETIIIDAINSRLVTVMSFSNYEFKEIPDSWFQREYLPHIMAD